jgi:hypothetical protein
MSISELIKHLGNIDKYYGDIRVANKGSDIVAVSVNNDDETVVELETRIDIMGEIPAVPLGLTIRGDTPAKGF